MYDVSMLYAIAMIGILGLLLFVCLFDNARYMEWKEQCCFLEIIVDVRYYFNSIIFACKQRFHFMMEINDNFSNVYMFKLIEKDSKLCIHL